VLSVQYDDTPLTAGIAISSFNLDIRELVPEVFNRFPGIAAVKIVARGSFKDVRGNKSVDPMFRITFSRANAARIQWKDILLENIPKVADAYWVHPAMMEK